LISEGITHIQYTDDTILMVESDDTSIINMKFILYYFEWLSSLKINYHKSEAFCFDMEGSDRERISNMLNCQWGELQLKYLGIHISDNKMVMDAMNGLVNKVAKRIPPWRGKHMSLGGMMIMSNSYLVSLPTYTVGVYLLNQGTHKKMDSIRAKFFLEGSQ
jgi:hypothetical protein